MCALHERGFAVPRPLGQSRHVVIMELCDGVPLTQVAELEHPVEVANELLHIIERLAQHGLVHCDLNEFNIMIDDEEKVTIIDFPQMVSTCHVDAQELFDRDTQGIVRFFMHRYGVPEDELHIPDLEQVIAARGEEEQLDAMVAASGFKNITSEGQYGFQDLGEAADAEIEEDIGCINTSTLEFSEPKEEHAEVEKEVERTEVLSSTSGKPIGGELNRGSGEEQEGGGSDSEESTTSSYTSAINRELIEARVRRQRSNQKQRRQMARRNVVKDSEKRKVKVEMSSKVWQ